MQYTAKSSKNFPALSCLAITVTLLLSGCSSSEKESEDTTQQVILLENKAGPTEKSQDAAVNTHEMVEHQVLVRMEQPQARQYQRIKSAVRPALVSGMMADASVSLPQRENYQHYPENGVWTVAEQPLSTFSVDVDTASYSNIRRMLEQGISPPADAVRIEEMLNYFDYHYPQPQGDVPFHLDTRFAASPLNPNKHLLRVALSGKTITAEQRAPANLVFLLDVSGSMSADDKLPLLKRALQMLVNQLDNRDSVSIVVYAGASGVVLEPTSGDDKLAISQALDKLQAGGSTNGSGGIQLAYQMAKKAFKAEGVNRVLLATDGDFNVGTTDHDELMQLIEKQRKTGVNLSVLGFGRGNYNDHLTEQLADKGNGNAAYIDNINEARKVLVEQLTGTLQVIAKDVKIQVEFNPNTVHEYRLIGYENRALNKEDFNNDKVDAGDIGAGHQVTALYELTLKTAGQYDVDTLRYQNDQRNAPSTTDSKQDEIALVKLRYKAPDGEVSQKLEQVVHLEQMLNFHETDSSFQFAHSVAGLGQLLKGSKFVSVEDAQTLIEQAKLAKGDDEQGYRAEFIRMMENWLLLQHSSQFRRRKPQR
ncbi:vWA domain-containing protein [Planctobacterium marinum]|uniref:vWA domain-containing protein n=1 Tax=Planctobacterium marinum TaxID=1631968 RepID=UPI001E51BDDB|nr:VWA domain-containing protein [Planctobacterium marinum]MCC2608078.1 VWA domain-containing protein [Planctobacterium marinum]